MKHQHRLIVASSTLVAGAIAVALILRPSHTITPELPAPENIPAAIRGVIEHRMARHGDAMTALIGRIVVLDFGQAAEIAGGIYDEPALARPIGGDELNGALPARFFELQDDLRAQAKRVVEAAARKDATALAEQMGPLAKSCVACHDLYLHGSTAPAPAAAK